MHYNPFAIVMHNQWRLPRLVHHAAHAVLGVPVWLFALALNLPLPFVLLMATGVALLDKCVWIDWLGHRCHWVGLRVTERMDFASDLGLTMLGALLPSWRIALPVYYALSLFNGT